MLGPPDFADSEAYLNITAHVQASGKTPAEVAEEMRAAVKQETGLTISIGVGHCKMIAKVNIFPLQLIQY